MQLRALSRRDKSLNEIGEFQLVLKFNIFPTHFSFRNYGLVVLSSLNGWLKVLDAKILKLVLYARSYDQERDELKRHGGRVPTCAELDSRSTSVFLELMD